MAYSLKNRTIDEVRALHAANVRKSRRKNKNKVAARRKELYYASHEKSKEYGRKQYAIHRDRAKKGSAVYRKINPDKIKKYSHRVGAKKGKQERKSLKDAYLVSLIKQEGSSKTVTQKKKEVLQYRIKKIIKLLDNEKQD